MPELTDEDLHDALILALVDHAHDPEASAAIADLADDPDTLRELLADDTEDDTRGD